MPRVHRDYREGMCSRFTNESKFWKDKTPAIKFAREASKEGDLLREKLKGHRILFDVKTERELKNAFRL